MQLFNVSNNQPIFGRVLTSDGVKQILKSPNCKKSTVSKYKYVRNAFNLAKVSDTANFDIYICYSADKGFYASVVPKEGRVPNSIMKNFSNIKYSETGAQELREWVGFWTKYFTNLSRN